MPRLLPPRLQRLARTLVRSIRALPMFFALRQCLTCLKIQLGRVFPDNRDQSPPRPRELRHFLGSLFEQPAGHFACVEIGGSNA